MSRMFAVLLAGSLIAAPAFAQPAKPHAQYTITTTLRDYNVATDKYGAQVRISASPCPPTVVYDDTIVVLAKNADDAIVQAKDQLAKIEEDIQQSADKCAAH